MRNEVFFHIRIRPIFLLKRRTPGPNHPKEKGKIVGSLKNKRLMDSSTPRRHEKKSAPSVWIDRNRLPQSRILEENTGCCCIFAFSECSIPPSSLLQLPPPGPHLTSPLLPQSNGFLQDQALGFLSVTVVFAFLGEQC